MVTNNPRMSVEHNGHNSWTLNLEDVQRNDSGSYMCQINTEPMTSQVTIIFPTIFGTPYIAWYINLYLTYLNECFGNQN